MKPPFINVEEKIDKVVGRRTKTPDAWQSGMKLLASSAKLHVALGHHWAPKGVYRFETHEEADEWMLQMLVRSDLPRS